MSDQFAFRPAGSTTAAIIHMLDFIYKMFESNNDYVRALLIDYSKAFDSVNHIVLLEELGSIGFHSSVFRWVSDFLAGRLQAVKVGPELSDFAPITRSIVQGSGLGPTLYIALARKLKCISSNNRLYKYADDSSLLAPQNTDCTIENEFNKVKKWSASSKLVINVKKTKEIIFYKSKFAKSKHTSIPEIDGIERVQIVTLLGVIFNSELSWTPHIDNMLKQISQRFYLIGQLKSMSLSPVYLDHIFDALVLSWLRYALEAYSGNVLMGDVDRINAVFRKARRWGLTSTTHVYQNIADGAVSKLARKIMNPDHCLHSLIPPIKHNTRYALRNNDCTFSLPLIKNDKYLNSFIPRSFH